MHHIINFESEQAGSFPHIDGNGQIASTVEKAKRFANGDFVVVATQLSDRVMPLEKKLEAPFIPYLFK
ncbi:MAG: hypothetical protein R2788_08945 [Saprospiraceae bacterium]